MRRLFGGIAVLSILFAACSDDGADIEVGDYPITAPSEPSTTTEAPAAATEPSTSVDPPAATTTASPALDRPRAEVCRTVEDELGTPIEVCARDLGFPGIRGATIDRSGVGIAIVDPDVMNVVARVWPDQTLALDVESEDGVSFVTATYVDEFQALRADGGRHHHGTTISGIGDDPILIASGETEFDDRTTTYSIWFDRHERVCAEHPVLNGPAEYVCVSSIEESARGGGWFSVAVGEHCLPAQIGFAAAIALVDDGSTGEVRVGERTVETTTGRLPNGHAVNWVVFGFPAGSAETASLHYTAGGTAQTLEIGLPIPAPPTVEYPQGCPPNGPPPPDYPGYPSQ